MCHHVSLRGDWQLLVTIIIVPAPFPLPLLLKNRGSFSQHIVLCSLHTAQHPAHPATYY